MKIAFLSVFYPYRGGISQFNAELYTELCKTHEVKAFNFSRQYPNFLFPGKTQYVDPEDTNAKKIESERILDSANPLTYKKTAKTILAWGPDLVLFSYWMSYFAVSLTPIAKYLKSKGVKVVSVVHNAIPHEPKSFDKPLAKKFFSVNDGLVSMCDAVTSDIKTLCPDAKILQRYHPLYDHFGEKIPRDKAREKLGLDKDKKTLLFFGLIRDYKGLDTLIDAFSTLDSSYQLVIAGECYGKFDKYETLISANDNKDRIHVFKRYISDEEVPVFFSAADVCVLPYRSATQSGITAVSVNFDLPVIATPVGGLPEMVEKPRIGIVASDTHPYAIAAAIKDYFSEAGAQEYYTDKIQQFKGEISWSAFAADLSEFCKKLS